MYSENQCELRVAGCALILSPCFSKRNSQPATDNENQFLNLGEYSDKHVCTMKIEITS